MNIVYKEELDSKITASDMFGSKGFIYTCIFNDKIFVYKEIPNITDEQINNLEIISTIKNKNLVFPKFLVYDKNKFSGYITEYINYLNLYNLNYLSKDKKIKILKLVKKAILNMHKDKIIHTDLHPFNILYKNKKVKIIDFDNSIYKFNRNLNNLNPLALKYLDKNDLDFDVDIFMFNITTLSFLYDIPFYDVLNFKIDENLSNEEEEICDKVKRFKKLNENDYLIDYK